MLQEFGRAALFGAALFAVLSVQAGSMRFRSGEIIAAELAARAPEGFSVDKMVTGELPKSCAYAMLVVKLDRGRGVSIYDYSLKFMGRDYPCIALIPEGTSFDAARWEYPGNEGARCALFFAIDNSVISERTVLPLILKCNVPSGGEVEFPFTVQTGGVFTSPDKIPAAGAIPTPGLK